jgi:hypothetical protein
MYLYISCYYGPNERNVYGRRFKSYLIPWISLVGMQVIMWGQVSFLGHFIGILVGMAFCYRLLGCFLPSPEWISACEEWNCVKAVRSKVRFVEIDSGNIATEGFKFGIRRDGLDFERIQEAELSVV